MSDFAPISFLADAEDAYAWCRARAEECGAELPRHVAEFFNRQVPEVATIAGRAVELEVRGSALTQEAELKRREIERLTTELRRRSHPVVKAVAELAEESEKQYRRAEAAHDAKDEANRRWFDATKRIAELESRPVSAPPAVPGSRDYYMRPQDYLGHNAVAMPQLAADLPIHEAHRDGDHRLCTPNWCPDAPLPSGRMPAVEQLDDEISRRSAEAGIEPEDALGMPGLTAQEGDDFMAGGAR